MAELPVPRPQITARLRKIEGQIRGVAAMVEQERPCVDILVQLAATKSAIHSVAALVLQNYASICMEQKVGADAGRDLARAVAMWVGRG